MTIKFGTVGVGGRDKTSFHDMKRLNWLRTQAVCDLDEERMNNLILQLAISCLFSIWI